MLDIREIREDDGSLAASLARRGVTADQLAEVRALDERRRELIATGDELRARQKARSREIGAATGEERDRLIAETKEISAELDDLGAWCGALHRRPRTDGGDPAVLAEHSRVGQDLAVFRAGQQRRRREQDPGHPLRASVPR